MSSLTSVTKTIAYHQKKYQPLENCQINIATHAFQYATMVFGGIRLYYNATTKQRNIFRLADHITRLQQSARLLFMQPPYSNTELSNIVLELCKTNNLPANLYIRPFVYKYETQLSPRLHNLKDEFSVYLILLDDYLETETGLNVGISSWRRVDENSIPARAKCAGSYLNSSLAKSEAMLCGYDEAIFLDSIGTVSEGSAENIFIVRNGELITPPLAASVLEGITRRSILQLAHDLNIPYNERSVARAELYIADEVFLCGTGAQIAWVKSIDHREIADGEIGAITRRLRDLFVRIVYGEEPKYRHWLTSV